MNAFLGAIRNANLLLSLVAAAVLLFAVSPNDVASLGRAQAQVQALKALGDGRDGEYADWALQVFQQEDEEYLAQKLRGAFAALGQRQISKIRVSMMPYVIRSPRNNWTLQQLSTFFLSTARVDDVEPSPNGFKGAYYDAVMKGICSDELSHKVPCKGIPVDGASVVIALIGPTEPGSFSVTSVSALGVSETIIYDSALPNKATGELRIDWYTKSKHWRSVTHKIPLSEMYRGIPVDTDNPRYPPPVKWLQVNGLQTDKNLANLATLAPEGHGETVFLPDVQEFWTAVSTRTPEGAINYLQGKLDSSRQSIILFGLAVDQRVVLLVAPMSIAAASLYLLSLIGMLLTGMEKAQLEGASLQLYPWVGVFSDRLSIFVSTISIVLLPPLASIALLANPNYWHGTDKKALVVAVIGTVCVIVISGFTWQRLIVLRQRFRGAAFPVTSGSDNDGA